VIEGQILTTMKTIRDMKKVLSTCDRATTAARAVLPAEEYVETMQVVLADLRPEEEEDSDMEKEDGVQGEQLSLKRARGQGTRTMKREF
jgi:hypothetical protein